MQTPKERLAFSKRLKQALTDSPEKIKGSTKLALHFNLRNPGKPVTQQAAHKWLTGQSIPKREHIEVLASWLGVDASWLQVGEAAQKAKSRPQSPSFAIAEQEGQLLRILSALLRVPPKAWKEVETYLNAKAKLGTKPSKK